MNRVVVVLALSAALFLLAGLAPRTALAADILVGTTADEYDTTPNGICSLREAIQSANTNANFGGCSAIGGYASGATPDVIRLSAGTYKITRSGADDSNENGDFDITSSISIVGAGMATTRIDGMGIERVFDTFQNPTVSGLVSSISNVTITGGQAAAGGGVFVYNGVTMNLTAVMLTGNAVSSNGAAIQVNNDSVANITDSTIASNIAGGFGGGIFSTGKVVLHTSTVSGNRAEYGAGIYADVSATDTLEIDKSIITGNVVEDRPGGPANDFGDGGGVFVQGTGPFTMTRSHLTSNTAPRSGGGLFIKATTTSPAVTVQYNRIAGNTSPASPSGDGVERAGSNGTVTLDDNWWGCNEGPTDSDCDRTSGVGGITTWLQLRGSASPATVAPSGTTTLTADIFGRNSGSALTPTLLTGLPSFVVTFDTATNGFVPGSAQVTDGDATVTFLAGTVGPASARATVDNASVTINLTVATPNTNPSVTNPASLSQSKTYNEDDASVALDDIVVSDPDSGDTITAKLTLQNPAAGSLTATTPSTTYTAGTGVWQVSGSVSVVNTALAAVAFVPAASKSLDTSITVEIFDQPPTVDVTGSIALDGTAVNDPPGGASTTVTTNEDTAYTFTAADFGFSDPNDSPADAFLAVKIASGPTAGTLKNGVTILTGGETVLKTAIDNGDLKFSPVANANGAGYASFTFQVQDNGGTANGGVDLDPTPNTITVNVTSVNDPPQAADKTVTMNESTTYVFTAADFGFTDLNDNPPNNLERLKFPSTPSQGTLADGGFRLTTNDIVSRESIDAGRLTYTPVAGASGNGYATFLFMVQDDGGVANGGFNFDQTHHIITIDVVSVNSEPAGADKTVTTNEDTAYTFAAADFGFSDPNDSPANSLLAVKVGAPSAGTLKSGSTTLTGGEYVLKTAIDNGDLKFTPVANANGNPYATISFQVQDDGGVANSGVDLDQSANTITVKVTAVNDAPRGADKTVTTSEETTYTFTPADFGFTDPNDSPANGFAAVVFTTVPSPNRLVLVGQPVALNSIVLVSQITNGSLQYIPVPGASGSPAASFTFKVQDDGGLANGGVDLDPTARTVTINVTAVNDAPSGADKTVTTNEDVPYTFTVADFGFTDPNDTPANSLLAVNIPAVSGAGSLTINNVAVAAPQTVSAADIAGGKLKLTPAPGASGNAYASFTFQVQDDGGTANGGVDLDLSANTMTINVVAVADGPTATNLTQAKTYPEDAASVALDDIVVSDDDIGETITATLTLAHPTRGSLNGAGGSYNPTSGAWTASGSVAQVNAALAGVVFVPAANNDQDTSIRTLIRDAANTGPAEGSIALHVSAANDAPTTIALTGSSVAEGSPNNTVIGTLSVTDPDTGDTGTFSLADSAGGRFGVSGNKLIVANGALINFEASSTHQIVVRATDAGGLSIERPFTITVTDVPEALSTSSDSYTTAAGKALTVPAPGVLQNDVDPAGRPLTAIKASDPQHGSLTLNANGSFTYTPVPGFAGVDGFTYRASNGDEPSQPITVTITVLPTLSITGGEVQEGNTGTRPGRLTVTLSNPSSQPVSVRVTSANGTASEGQDYQRLQTTVAFAPGETSKPVDVQVIGDTADEAAETVSVGLSVPTNAALGVEVATLTIVDDDGPALGAQADHCTPRPAIQVRTRQVGPGVLEVTISDQDGQIGTTGGMLLVRLQPDASSVVDLAPGMSSTYPQGGTGLTGALAMKPARPEQDFVFTIRRTGSGPFTVGVTVNDSCGEWKTFAGGGQGI